jgi:hypothetical protein
MQSSLFFLLPEGRKVWRTMFEKKVADILGWVFLGLVFIFLMIALNFAVSNPAGW